MLVGLTGGIATGKSTVSQMFKERGAVIIDSDLIARQVVEPGQLALKQIEEQFGSEIIQPDGSLNRKALGKIIFDNKEARVQLERITHPPIFVEIERQIEEAKKNRANLIVLDSPLLIEAKRTDYVELVILVYADEATQMRRLLERDQISKEAAILRIQAQMPIDEKRAYADIIIDNCGSVEDLEQQVDEVFASLTSGKST